MKMLNDCPKYPEAINTKSFPLTKPDGASEGKQE